MVRVGSKAPSEPSNGVYQHLVDKLVNNYNMLYIDEDSLSGGVPILVDNSGHIFIW